MPPSLRKFWSRCGIFTLLILVLLGAPGHAALDLRPIILSLPAGASGFKIQQALDELPPHGEVVLAEGTYEISQPLMLRHDFETLRGSGPGTILHLTDAANCPVVILGPPLTETKHPAAHLHLANLLVDGNRARQTTEHWSAAADGSEMNNNGVQVWNATDAVVEHVTCRQCRSGGLVAAEVVRLQVSDFESYDNHFDGLACYQTESSRFDGLRLHDNLAAGISLDLAFNNNIISRAEVTGNDVGIFMRFSRNNTFQGLVIAKSRHDGIFMAQTAVETAKGWALTPDTECTGNKFENLQIFDCGGRAFQVNDASCVNNSISGARFSGNVKGGLVQPPNKPVSIRALLTTVLHG